MNFTRRSMSAGLAAGVAMPAVLRRRVAQGATMKIGMVLPVTGPAADSGRYALTGAKIALEQVNKAGGVLGKQIELVTEDDQTTNPGAVLAFSKLAVAARHRRLSRLHPLDAKPCDGAGHPEDRQARHVRRHRSGADPHGQSSGCSAAGRTIPIPAACSPISA